MVIWQKNLRLAGLGVDEDFFSAGGDSLSSSKLVLDVEDFFGLRMPAEALENLSTVAVMATYLREALMLPLGRRDKAEVAFANIRNFIAAWKGARLQPDSFIVTLNHSNTQNGFFWCCQSFTELLSLAKAMGESQVIHGMRSGHLAFEYEPDIIDALAVAYAREIMLLQPDGDIIIGGNCQGGLIARATANALKKQGRIVGRLIMMEQSTYWPYDQYVDLLFGYESTFNPTHRVSHPSVVLEKAYPAGYSLHFISGSHGTFFNLNNVDSLADKIRLILKQTV
jgi:hypothetical protein